MVANINSCPERDRYVIWDEMHIKSDLVYDKHSGEYITCVHCMYMCNIHVYTSCSYFFLIYCAKALEQFGGDEAAETAKFVSMFDKMFDCLNVQTFSAGKLSRNCFKAPYQSSRLSFEGELCMCVHVHTVHVRRLYMTSTSMCMYTSVF